MVDVGNKKSSGNRLKKLTIEGFKSIKKLDLKIQDLNILIGANGAGKTNLLSFFRMLNYITSKGLGNFVGISGGADALLYYGSKQTPQMECKIHFETRSGANEYAMRLVSAASDQLIFADEQVSFTRAGSDSKAPLVSLGAGHKETMLPDQTEEVKGRLLTGKVIRNIMDRWRFYHFHDTSNEARIKKHSRLDDNHYLRDDAGNLAAFLYMLRERHPKHYSKIVSLAQLVAPFFDDFVLRPSKLNPDRILLEWKEKNNEYIFSANQLSDGMLRMFSLITLLSQPESEMPSLILIDEPELGLHPYAIKVLASLLQSASMHSQIIISTQSISLINAFSPEDMVVVDREGKQSVFKRLDANELEEWLEEYTIGELWEKNVIGGRPS